MWINGKHIHSCTGNLEGLLAKRKGDPYLPDHTNWLNRNYARWVGREKLFERERAGEPDWHLWNACALVADRQTSLAGSCEAALLCLRLLLQYVLAGALLAVVWR